MLKGLRNSAVLIVLVIAPSLFSNSYRADLEHFRNQAEYAFDQIRITHPNELLTMAANRLRQAENGR